MVSSAVYPCSDEFLHFDIQSIGQKSHCVIDILIADPRLLETRENENSITTIALCTEWYNIGCKIDAR